MIHELATKNHTVHTVPGCRWKGQPSQFQFISNSHSSWVHATDTPFKRCLAQNDNCTATVTCTANISAPSVSSWPRPQVLSSPCFHIREQIEVPWTTWLLTRRPPDQPSELHKLAWVHAGSLLSHRRSTCPEASPFQHALVWKASIIKHSPLIMSTATTGHHK